LRWKINGVGLFLLRVSKNPQNFLLAFIVKESNGNEYMSVKDKIT